MLASFYKKEFNMNLQDMFDDNRTQSFVSRDSDYKKKISEALKGRQQSSQHIENAKNARQKVMNARTTPQKCPGNQGRNPITVHTPEGTFNSIKAAADHYGVASKTFTYWLYVSKTNMFTAECQK